MRNRLGMRYAAARPRRRQILALACLMALCLAGSVTVSCSGGAKPAATPQPVPAPAKPDLAALINAKDTAGIKDFFKNRELLSTADSEGYYPLHRAVQQNSPDIVDLLAALGAPLESTDSRGRTPLRLAIDEGKDGPAKVLADRGSSIFSVDSSGTTAAGAALAKGEPMFSAVFTAKTVSQRAQDGTTALHVAADGLLEDAVHKLVDLGADTSARNQAGRLPVDMALLHPDRVESARIAEFLIQKGPSPTFAEFAWFAQAARAMNYSTLRYEDGNTPLHEAVAARQKGFVQFLLVEKKVSPNVRNTAGSAPLHDAVRLGWYDGAELLLKNGADPNVRDGFDNTPLHIALPADGREKAVGLLLDNGADPSLKDRNGNIPLHIAVQLGYSAALVDRLLQAGSPINAANSVGDTPLHIAVRNGHLEFVPSLIAKGADIFIANGRGETPLSIAIVQSGGIGATATDTASSVQPAPQVAATSSSATSTAAPGAPAASPTASKPDPMAALAAVITSANVSAKDNLGNTPLHVAVGMQASPLAIALIASRGGDANARNNAGDTPLHLAVRRNWRPQGESLLQARADIFVSNVKGETPLSIALAAAPPIDWLFNSQTIAARDAYGDTPLHYAARYNLGPAIDFLCQKGADPNARNSDGASPLAAAVKADSAAAASALLKNGASLLSRDAMGDTALHTAVLWSARNSMPILLDAGADPNARNLSGESPLHQAAKKHDVESLRLLLGRGAKVQARDNRGATPLFVAARNGALDAARFLVESGAEIDARDLSGRSPLAASVDAGELDTARYLVGAGASILARDGKDESPLTMAAKKGRDALDAVITPANINVADSGGRTPLRILVDQKPLVDVIEAALAKKANVDTCDCDSRTALHAALSTGNLVVAARLAAAGADIFARDKNGETPVSLAIGLGPDALKAILAGDRLRAVDPLGATALHYAAQAGNAAAIDWLIQAGVDRTVRNILGESAADIAGRLGFSDIAAKLK